MKCLHSLSIYAFITALCITTFTLVAKFFWFFELFTHYAPYYLVIGLLFTLLHSYKRQFKMVLLWTSLSIIFLVHITPYLKTSTSANSEASIETSAAHLTLFSQNFYYLSTNTDQLVELVKKENPDILLVHEASKIWIRDKEKFRKNYPYLHLTQNPGIHGILVASRIPGTFKEVPLGMHIGLVFTPANQTYQILAVHPSAPLTPNWAADRNAQLKDIAHFVKASSTPVVVMGDFNLTPWSPYFTELLEDGDLRDARLGFGLIPTWHAHNWLFKLPIDHALVSPSFEVLDFKTSTAIESDHYGILVKLKL